MTAEADTEPNAWLRDAACLDHPTAAFYPDRYDYRAARAAIAICEVCPVSQPCLDDALGISPALDRYGIFGAMTPSGRRRERRRRNRELAAAAAPPVNGHANGHPPRRAMPRHTGSVDWLEAALGR